MRVRVVKISCSDSMTIVNFTSQYGDSRGKWGSTKPQLNSEYDVELEIGVRLNCAVNFQLAGTGTPLIAYSENMITIVAQIVEVFADGGAFLRLGDSLMFVEYEGDFPAVDTWIELYTNEVTLFNANL